MFSFYRQMFNFVVTYLQQSAATIYGSSEKKQTIFNTLKSMSNDPVLQLGSKPNFSKSLTIRSKTDISSRR